MKGWQGLGGGRAGWRAGGLEGWQGLGGRIKGLGRGAGWVARRPEADREEAGGRQGGGWRRWGPGGRGGGRRGEFGGFGFFGFWVWFWF